MQNLKIKPVKIFLKFIAFFAMMFIILFAGFTVNAVNIQYLNTFSDGSIIKSFLFPVGGGSDNSAKITIPMDMQAFSAHLDVSNNLPLKQPVMIVEHSGNDLTDYSVLLIVDTASLISAGKMRNDCGDIRFKDAAGNDLFYWLESGCNTNSTNIWVKIPFIPSNGQTTIWMHYNNPTLTNDPNLNDPDKVFLYADNFEKYTNTAALLASWNMTTNSRGDVTYHAELDNTDFQSPTHSLKLGYTTIGNIGGADVWTKVEKDIDIGSTFKAHLKFKARITEATEPIINYIKVFVNGIEIWQNNSAAVGTNWDNKDVDLSAYSGVITIGLLRQHEWTHHTNFYSFWDDIIIRQCVNPEPSFSFGPEEIAEGIPIINAQMDVGSDGTIEWQEASLITRKTVSGFEDEINNLLKNCTCHGCIISGNNCTIDLKMITASDGGIVLDNLEIVYGVIKGGLIPCGRHYDNIDTPNVDERDECTICHFFLMIKNILDFVMKLAVIVAILFIAFGGLLYIFSTGREDLLIKAKGMILWALAGFVLIFAAWIFIALILSVFGYTDPLGGQWDVIC